MDPHVTEWEKMTECTCWCGAGGTRHYSRKCVWHVKNNITGNTPNTRKKKVELIRVTIQLWQKPNLASHDPVVNSSIEETNDDSYFPI